jgi:serine/threonine-protein kinase
MTADRWDRVERLYHEALERPAGERMAWLAAECGGDAGLRDEVEALVRSDDADPHFLSRSAVAVAAQALAREGADALCGRRLGGYDVLAHIGAGGMGEVYRALDVRLQREVALKVFEHATSTAGLARIEAEARAASVLTHPNIVTIHGVGEEGDTVYIAMELVRGRTLRDLLREGPLPVSRVLEIAVPIADAMAAAHACGIVHRDLKPENVMITGDGRVKVLDFGIATRPAADGPPAGAAPRGPLAGTIGYMSPELAGGRAVVAASDQFAFGLICHEMLTGRRLFARTTGRESIEALASADPIPDLLPQEAPAPLAAVIARCLAKDPDRRYPDSADLVTALRTVEVDLARAKAPAAPTRRLVLVLGGLAAVGSVVGAAAWHGLGRLSAPRSLAVLPFANPARDERTEFLCDGLTETLIRQLAGLPGLTVTARATSFAFKDHVDDPRAVGKRLGVTMILSGTLARRAGRVLVSAELVESASGARLWGADFDRPVSDVLAVQRDIAGAILRDGMHLTLTEEQRERLSRVLPEDAAAYESFLQAVHHLRLSSEEDYLAARALLLQAVDRAPRFALAFVTLASTYSVMAIDGYEAPAKAWPQADRYVARALDLDPGLADAHAEAAASALFYRWDWREAERRWGDALRLRNEVQSELLTAYALEQWALGRTEAGLEAARAARQVDPLSPQAAIREADLLAATRRFDEAAAAYERVIRDRPDEARARFGLAEVRRRQGRFDEAFESRRLAHAAAGDETLDALFASARGAAGYEAVVRATARLELQCLSDREAAGGYVSPLDRARAFAQLGETPQAFAHLRAALDERAAGLVLLNVDPAWDALRGDARFADAVRRVGIS